MRSLLELKEATIDELRNRLNKIGPTGEDQVTNQSKPRGSIVGENYRENITEIMRKRNFKIL